MDNLANSLKSDNFFRLYLHISLFWLHEQYWIFHYLYQTDVSLLALCNSCSEEYLSQSKNIVLFTIFRDTLQHELIYPNQGKMKCKISWKSRLLRVNVAFTIL